MGKPVPHLDRPRMAYIPIMEIPEDRILVHRYNMYSLYEFNNLTHLFEYNGNFNVATPGLCVYSIKGAYFIHHNGDYSFWFDGVQSVSSIPDTFHRS